MTFLSVNVNKIATLRNARGTDKPNLLNVTQDIVTFGAKGITVHPRPDERHITQQDAYELASWLQKNSPTVEYNMEGYPDERFLKMVYEIRPHQCTLVPDPPEVITSNAGWNVVNTKQQLITVCEQLKAWKVRSSIFVNPYDVNLNFLEALQEIQPDRVELYTEMYAKAFSTQNQKKVTEVYKNAAQKILELGVELNAGHDLDQQNLKDLIENIPQLKEVSIGHALICEALYEGLEATIKNYLRILCR
ncbi:MAG: pyridoxine 5'-phosphate synthase [Bdellovibrionales bacterium]|nr:pyridoxine 5'-phosphate synthase [Bdellovibrionales bacterium]